MRTTARRAAAALAGLAVAAAAIVALAAPAQAVTVTFRKPNPITSAECTETLVYEHSGVDADGPFIDRAYERNCGSYTCTLYYTSRDGGVSWRLVFTDCPAPSTATRVVPRRR